MERKKAKIRNKKTGIEKFDVIEDNKALVADLGDSKVQLLKDLAKDIVMNKVFTDRHIQKTHANMLFTVFMPLAFMDKKGWAAMGKVEEIGLIYEYYEKATTRSINGYPTFQSFKYLKQKEANVTLDYVAKYKRMLGEE